MNYYDILLAKKLEDERDPKVEGLSVTANGTYSEEGKVYKPVIVNVAGYGLADMPGGAIASFSDGAALPLNNLKISIVPVQSGSGDPSPTNIRPIIGWDEVNVTVADDTTDPTTEKVYTIDLDGTRYGGTLDVVSGVLTVDRAYVDLGTLNWSYTSSSGRNLFTSNDITDYKHTGASDIPVNAICECFVIVPMSSIFVNGQMGMDGDNVRNRTIICDNRYSNASDFKTAMNGVQLVYELATPITIQLTPVAVKSLNGVNNVYADTGNIIEGQYFKSL